MKKELWYNIFQSVWEMSMIVMGYALSVVVAIVFTMLLGPKIGWAAAVTAYLLMLAGITCATIRVARVGTPLKEQY